jgi:hypothetical protein
MTGFFKLRIRTVSNAISSNTRFAAANVRELYLTTLVLIVGYVALAVSDARSRRGNRLLVGIILSAGVSGMSPLPDLSIARVSSPVCLALISSSSARGTTTSTITCCRPKCCVA